MKKKKEEKNIRKTEAINQGGFKSELIKRLLKKYDKSGLNEAEVKEMPKENNSVNLSDILYELDNLSDAELSNVISDINLNNIKVTISAPAIEMLNDKDSDKDRINALLAGIKGAMDVDINSISELSTDNFKSILKSCKVDKVYVNSGFDKAAKEGYSAEKYMQIRENADAMINTALGKDKDSLSDVEKFKRLYKYVTEHTKYDYGKADVNCMDSRNLDNFFTKGRYVKNGQLKGNGRAVCAGIADGLKNLCDCLGIEAQYIQGNAKKKDGSRVYHAWVRVKLNEKDKDGNIVGSKWYNSDPTWDLGKVGPIPFSYCLKSDKDFTGHTIDYAYNPTYSRKGIDISRIINTSRLYETADKSIENPFNLTKAVIEKYTASRTLNNIIHMSDNRKLDELAQALNEEKIPADLEAGGTSKAKSTRKLSLKQKLANLLFKGKHIKNIPFIKKFIDKNTTLKLSEDNRKANTVKNNGLYRTDGKLNEAIKNSKNHAVTKSKEAKQQNQR